MPPVLAHRLAEWTAGTARWLRRDGARLVVACRPEYWEQAGALLPPGCCTGPRPRGGSAAAALRPPGRLHREEARGPGPRYGLPEGALAPPTTGTRSRCGCSREVRAALPGPPDGAAVDRDDVFAAHLDLVCLRIAVRLAAAGTACAGPPYDGSPAQVAGQVHEAARRCLGPGQGGAGPGVVRGALPAGATGAGRPPCSPRACSCRPAADTASPTRSSPTGSRAPTSTWTRPCTRWSTARAAEPPEPAATRSRSAPTPSAVASVAAPPAPGRAGRPGPAAARRRARPPRTGPPGCAS